MQLCRGILFSKKLLSDFSELVFFFVTLATHSFPHAKYQIWPYFVM